MRRSSHHPGGGPTRLQHGEVPEVREAQQRDLGRARRRAREHVVLGQARYLAHGLQNAQLRNGGGEGGWVGGGRQCTCYCVAAGHNGQYTASSSPGQLLRQLPSPLGSSPPPSSPNLVPQAARHRVRGEAAAPLPLPPLTWCLRLLAIESAARRPGVDVAAASVAARCTSGESGASVVTTWCRL